VKDAIKKLMKKGELAALWLVRILLAPSHFKVGLFTKLRMNFFGGYLSDQYVLYDFAHNNPKDYLSEFDWYRSRWINEPFEEMLNNKIICTSVLKSNVIVPEALLMKNKGRMVSLEQDKADGFKTFDDVVELLEQHEVLFMKPVSSGKGDGVCRISLHEGDFYINEKLVDKTEIRLLLANKDAWFLSKGIKQHSFEDSLYDKTTNTIRIITLRDFDTGCIKIFFAVQRIGTSATIPVDNGSKGGLVANINLETGQLSEARSLQKLVSYANHPDSGSRIEGQVIPGWNEIKEEVLALARKFPFLNFIAWDVLLTEQGICVVEANTSSGVNIIQLWGPQRNSELGDFYRFHKVIK